MIRKVLQLFRVALNPAALDVALRNGQMVVPLADSAGIQWVRVTLGGTLEATIVQNGSDAFPNSYDANIVESFMYGFNDTTWDRIRALSDALDGQAPETLGALLSLARQQAFNGTSWDRHRSVSAANMTAATPTGIDLVNGPGQWSVFSQPAAATQAIATRAAGGAGVRHVCKTISGTTTDTTTLQVLQLLDGATVVWSQVLGGTGGAVSFSLSELNIVGTANTAMTLQFSVAPAAGKNQAVAETGFDTV